MYNSVIYHVLRCILGYTNDQQHYHWYPLSHFETKHSSVLINILAWVCSILSKGVYAYLTHDDLQVDKKCTQMTLDISMLDNNFPLYIKTRIYHLNYPNALC